MLSYYNTPGVRETCHALKGDYGREAQTSAIITVADYFLSEYRLGRDDIIIPAPQHTGRADYTLRIAQILQEATSVQIVDILGRKPEKTLYELKKKNKKPDVNMFLTGHIPSGENFYFLDNVIDTALTFRAATYLCGVYLKPMVYAVNSKRRSQLHEADCTHGQARGVLIGKRSL